jgi:hypothetical protein
LPEFSPLDASPDFTVESVAEQYFHLDWTDVPGQVWGYVLRYGPAGCNAPQAATVADEGPPAILVPPGNFEFDLQGLSPDQLYWFEIAAIDANGLPGKAARAEKMLLDTEDLNNDDLPDAWATFYGITSPTADLDLDRLDNLGEYHNLSNPAHADSDGDGFYDGEELDWGTDICGPDKPPYHAQPILALFGLQQYNLRTATNQGPITSQLSIVNFGQGQLFWDVMTDVSWLTFYQSSGSGDANLVFTANPDGLAPGTYAATITIRSLPPVSFGGSFIPETTEVQVRFVVMPEIVTPDPNSYVMLPVVLRP